MNINVTVSFTVPQALATGEAIERGLKRREAEGKDVSTVGPVVTIMVGRLDDWLKEVVARDGIEIDPEHLEWAGIAAVKRAYTLFQERGLRARVLAAAYRNQLQWTELVGGDLVLSPPFGWGQKFDAAASTRPRGSTSRSTPRSSRRSSGSRTSGESPEYFTDAPAQTAAPVSRRGSGMVEADDQSPARDRSTRQSVREDRHG